MFLDEALDTDPQLVPVSIVFIYSDDST